MKAPKSVLTTWPQGWRLQMGSADELYALNRGLSPRETFEEFQDYHLAHGSRFASWSAAWRTWVRNAQKYAREKNPQPVSNSPLAQMKKDRADADAEWNALTPEEKARRRREVHDMVAKITRAI